MDPEHREAERPEEPEDERALGQELGQELLIQRVVVGEAGEADWDRLEAAAATRPELWETAVRTMRVQASLQRSMDAALIASEGVELPPARVLSPGRSVGWRGLSGWAAAVLVLAAWFGATRGEREDSDGSTDEVGTPSLAREESPQDPGSDDPRPEFVQDLPSQVLATRPLGDGRSVEVTYVKRHIERALVDQVYGLARDEAGQTKAVAVSASRLAALQRF